MSAAKHTPGPWEVRGCELVGQGTLLATLHWHSGRASENAADKDLIALAPDLLADNERLREALRAIQNDAAIERNEQLEAFCAAALSEQEGK